DNALPGSRLWSKVNPRTGTPTNSIWLCVTCSAILAAPAVVSTTAYLACTSIAVIGLYIAYVTPVLLRRLNPEFRQGAWSLGKWSALVGWIAVGWVAFIVVLFMLPPLKPITVNTFNYAPVAVAIVALFAWLSWITKGRKHFMRGTSEHVTKRVEEILEAEEPV
ncbi:MAG: amino acid permease, partial [Acidothermus sp.]|nr:amino acid permease [Acidothermus sp.]